MQVEAWAYPKKFLITTIACTQNEKPLKESEKKRKEIIPEPSGNCMPILPDVCASLAFIVNDGARVNRYIFSAPSFSSSRSALQRPVPTGSISRHADAAVAADSPGSMAGSHRDAFIPVPSAVTADIFFSRQRKEGKHEKPLTPAQCMEH